MKKAIKIIIICLFFFSIYSYICFVFTPKTAHAYGGNKYYEGKGFEAEDTNTIDVFAIGNSDLYSGFIPLDLYEKYGYTCYNAGVAKQTLGPSIKFIKQVRKNQDIKLVIVEADYLFENEVIGQSVQKLSALKFFATPFLYHVRWKKLQKEDFYKIPNKESNYDYLKGYRFETKVQPYEKKELRTNKITSLSKRNLRNLELLKTYCDNNNIELMMMMLPTPYNWNEGKNKVLTSLCKEKKIPFLDFNTNYYDTGFDYAKDFRDNGNHLNYFGAKKITTYLGEYIHKNYTLENHLGDSKYIKRDASLQKYHAFLKDSNLNYDNMNSDYKI